MLPTTHLGTITYFLSRWKSRYSPQSIRISINYYLWIYNRSRIQLNYWLNSQYCFTLSLQWKLWSMWSWKWAISPLWNQRKTLLHSRWYLYHWINLRDCHWKRTRDLSWNELKEQHLYSYQRSRRIRCRTQWWRSLCHLNKWHGRTRTRSRRYNSLIIPPIKPNALIIQTYFINFIIRFNHKSYSLIICHFFLSLFIFQTF